MHTLSFCLRCCKFQFIVLLHWRGSAQRLPLTRELSAKLTEGEKTPEYRFVLTMLEILPLLSLRLRLSAETPPSSEGGFGAVHPVR